jgi:hypothetical protein
MHAPAGLRTRGSTTARFSESRRAWPHGPDGLARVDGLLTRFESCEHPLLQGLCLTARRLDNVAGR